MKICPKCQTPNQDKNYYCVECNAVLTGAKHIDDSMIASEKIKKADRAHTMKKWSVVAGFVLVTLIMDVFVLYCAATSPNRAETFDYTKVWVQLPLYLPIAFLGLFNFDWAYQKIRTKKGLPEKHLSDTVNTALVGVSILLWFFLQCSIAGTVLFIK